MQSPIPADTFFGHVAKLRQTWLDKYGESFNSIILINGKVSQGNQRTVALVTWFLAGFNLADTIIAFTSDSVIIYSSQRKISFLSNLKEHPGFQKYNLSFMAKQEDSLVAYKKIWSELHGDNLNPKVGMLINDTRTGQVAQDFSSFLEKQTYHPVEIQTMFTDCCVCKDADQIENLRKSGKVTAYFQQKFINEIEVIIDNGKNVKHIDIAKKIQSLLSNESELKKCAIKLSKQKISKDFIDFGSATSVQSGGSYSSKLFVQPNDNSLKSDCIIVGMGTLYRSYNSYVSRTLLIEPTDEQKQTYKKIQALQKVIVQNLRPGVRISAIYKKAQQFLKANLSSAQVPKSFGFGIGIFLCENNLVISESNDLSVAIGNCFLINCSFADLKYESKKHGSKTYAIQLVDTVVVSQKGQQILTNDVSKNLSDISYSLDDEDEAAEVKREPRERTSQNFGEDNNGRVTRRRRRQDNTMEKLKNQKERYDHQISLKKVKLQQLQTRLNERFSGGFKKEKTIDCTKLNCYKSKQELPKDLKKDQIYVDNKANSILLPINGKHVPFHIKILKSVVRNDEGKFVSIRFNFHLPGTVANLVFPKINQTTIYVKEMVFRSENNARIADLEKQVKALQRKVRTETDEKHAKEDIIQQQKINLNKGKRPMLRQLFARPGIGQKKVKGTLECHLNGFRYTTVKGQHIDVPFNNIKHAFFQPCEKQIIAAIHFRLNEPVMVGKKKMEDIQFYSEGGPNAEDIGGRGRGGDDSDDEERQKEARKLLDREFQAFVKGCQQFTGKNIEFQLPRRNNGFNGTPFRTSSLLQPTKSCLINVTEYPFFVLVMSEVQVAFFERMYANIKSFDVTFVFKDYENHIRVSSIPISDVEKVKNWLDACNIIFYDMGKNMNWAKFLAGIRGDFKKFVEEGAWTAWDSDDEDGEDRELEQGDSQFSAASKQLEQEDSEESDSESGYKNQNGNQSAESDDQDLSEEGLSWDQLDERAEMEDRQKLKKQVEKKNTEGFKKKKR